MIRLTLATLAVSLCASSTFAEDCPIQGQAQTPDGKPAANVTVMMARGRFRPSVHQLVTNSDGTFAAPDLPCGTYQVFTGTGTVSIDTKKQRTISLTLDSALVRASEGASTSAREYQNARDARTRPLTPEEARDEATAIEFMDRTAASVMNAHEHQRYQRTTNREERKQLFYAAAWQRNAQAETARDEARDAAAAMAPRDRGFGALIPSRRSKARPDVTLEEMSASSDDRQARAQVNRARAFVARHVSDDAAASFDKATPRERARVVLTTSRSLLAEQTWPSAMVLAATDIGMGVGAKQFVRQVLGEDSPEVKEWDNNLSLRWRGETWRRTYLLLIDRALAVADGRLPLNQVLAGSETAIDGDVRTVRGAFGAAGVEEYQRRDADGKREMMTDAALSMIALGASMYAAP